MIMIPRKSNCQTPRMAQSFLEAWSRSYNGQTPIEDVFITTAGRIKVGLIDREWEIVFPNQFTWKGSKGNFLIELAITLSLAFMRPLELVEHIEELKNGMSKMLQDS